MAEKQAVWFDPRMTIGNVITIITVLVAITAGWYGFETRISLLESAVQRNQTRIDLGAQESRDVLSRVIRIEEKLNAQESILQRILLNTERGARNGRGTP